MTDDRHVRAEEYVEARRRPGSRGSLALRVQRHLVRACPRCEEEWALLAADQPRLLELLREAAEQPPEDPQGAGDLLSCYSAGVRREEEELARIRRLRQQARMQTWHLQRTRPEDRQAKVEGATAQYRSRAVAQYLLVRCREVIRNDPADAESLASLVPTVLRHTPGAEGEPWARDLWALAKAWAANARRVAGDLPAADRAFATLRRDLAREPATSPAVLAELRSLEASLRIDQRRYTEAAELLDHAGLLFRRGGDRTGTTRASLKQGNVLMDLDHYECALERFELAYRQLGRERTAANLRLTAVNGRILALCQLERYEEAQALLDGHPDVFEAVDDLHAGAVARALQGRIALGLGELTRAEEAFLACREGYLLADRAYDAALACLDLAEVYVASRQVGKLDRLAREVLPVFRAQQVARETLAVLRLLAEAVTSQQISRELIRDLRRRLQGHRRPVDPS